MKDIDVNLLKCEAKTISKPVIPKKICNSFEIDKAEKTSFEDAYGKTAAEYVYAYPPDIPILVPGEEISAEMIDEIKNMLINGINIISDSKLLPSYILTKAN